MTDAIRPLIAGNWKMNGLDSALARARPDAGAGGWRQGGRPGLSAGHPDLPASPTAAARAGGRRPGLPRQGQRRPYRRYLGGDARGCRRQPCHRRPFRAARRPRRDRRGGAAKAEAAWRAGLRPSSASARPWPSARPARRWRSAAASSQARCRKARRAANLVVAYEPVWAIGTGKTPTPAEVEPVHATSAKLLGRFGGRRQGAPSLWRLGEAATPPSCWRSPTSTARWSAAPA